MNSGKRILFVTMNLNSGGAERQIVTTASEFKKRGYIVEIACFASGDFYLSTLKSVGIPVFWIIVKTPVSRAFAFRRFIRKGNYDVVISYLESSNFINTFAAIGKHSWKVITGERSAQEDHLTSVKGRIFAWFLRYSDKIVCNSVNAKRLWLSHYPEYEHKLETIYNSVSIKKPDGDYVVRRDGITHLLIAASYQSLKNPINLIEAVNMLDETYRHRLSIEWYGQYDFIGSVYGECVRLIREYCLESFISLNGRTNNVIKLMNEADVIGLFSSVEGLPNTICEGMTLGKPIVMTRVSDYNILVNSENGWLCDWDNVCSIKKALCDIIDCPDETMKMLGKVSRDRADSLFSVESNIQKWIDLIN